ncbi:quinone oxidoreductase family protein [Roseivirga misakiensis]|uniref:Alcohol dehydrogenase n=1 Tax=Roseivirga misakiensis TaxID=1563681 RepID=A0A1E5SYS8_9BACT|nr:zinc-binding dehydrogenase [Roseivirga misakiensis]OEK04284.1 alcohol dehydrogenase [Roseivirga misakiensis]
MKALLITDQTEPLLISDVTLPEVGEHEVLVRLKAVALNRRDQWIRQGMYPNIKFGSVLGSDGAGIVEKVGPDVSDSLIGHEVIINPNVKWGSDDMAQSKEYSVLGMPKNGTFAEYIVVHENRLADKPEHLSWEEAAALPLGGLTAFRAIFHHGHLKPGDNVLISGAGGGVAQFAFLFATAIGANVYVTSGSSDKIEKCLNAGAKAGYNYKDDQWFKEAHKISGGFDVVIDSAGGNQINDFIKIMKPAGRIVFYGATNGTPEKLDMFRMFWNQITLQGSTMGNDHEFEDMVSFVKKHEVHPIIDSVRPFEDIISAFDDMKAGKQFGKLVVTL